MITKEDSLNELEEDEKLPVFHGYRKDEVAVKISFPVIKDVTEYSLALNKVMMHISYTHDLTGGVLFVAAEGYKFMIIAQHGRITLYKVYPDNTIEAGNESDLDNFTIATMINYFQSRSTMDLKAASRDALLLSGFGYAEIL